MRSKAFFDETRIEKWSRRIIFVICFLAWTYLSLHIGAHIERQTLAEQENLFLRHYAQKMDELKEKEEALIYAIRELKKRQM